MSGKPPDRSKFRFLAGAWLLAVALGSAAQPAAPPAPELEIRVIYDNTSARSDVQADWGFAAVVTFRERRVLFDSGTKPELFMTNLEKMEVDPPSIRQAVISHQHRDHRNGIYKLFPLQPAMRIHFLRAFYDEVYEARISDLAPLTARVYTLTRRSGTISPPERGGG